jgi:hypothetical protein
MDIRKTLVSQYRAALAMLRRAIEACPDAAWDDPAHENRFWHVAYHVVFYTHLYLSPSEEAFEPWEKSRPEANFLGPLPWPPHREPKTGEPYEKADILEYLDLVAESVRTRVESVPLDTPSGFPWLPFGRLELHVYNIRHVQHHVGQLADRVRREAGEGVEWVGEMP